MKTVQEQNHVLTVPGEAAVLMTSSALSPLKTGGTLCGPFLEKYKITL